MTILGTISRTHAITMEFFCYSSTFKVSRLFKGCRLFNILLTQGEVRMVRTLQEMLSNFRGRKYYFCRLLKNFQILTVWFLFLFSFALVPWNCMNSFFIWWHFSQVGDTILIVKTVLTSYICWAPTSSKHTYNDFSFKIKSTYSMWNIISKLCGRASVSLGSYIFMSKSFLCCFYIFIFNMSQKFALVNNNIIANVRVKLEVLISELWQLRLHLGRWEFCLLSMRQFSLLVPGKRYISCVPPPFRQGRGSYTFRVTGV